ncbi:hypothetical protein D0Y50_06850 [Salinimonas sediminis]|uniref:Uncharacterized protein n=1 Tax=Salinimonas sediminis TaxID=2303538 RepID=A0A346NKQ1_9ALTE|nr:hypothetical protein D0Y50_06850 [Salinimonas sediminis]
MRKTLQSQGFFVINKSNLNVSTAVKKVSIGNDIPTNYRYAGLPCPVPEKLKSILKLPLITTAYRAV